MNELCGWISNPEERDRIAAKQPFPIFGEAAPHLKDTGKGKDVFLWEREITLLGDYRMPNKQEIGDCVSMGTGQGAEDLEIGDLVDRGYKNDPETFKKVCTEAIYGGGRVEIAHQGGMGDGMIVAWAIDWGKQYGLIARGTYGSIDCTTYSGNRAKQWGNSGCPQELIPTAKKYPIVTCSLVQGSNKYEQARDAIANKCIVVTGSNQLFSQKRAANGFITPAGNGGHCTRYNAVTDNNVRPGIWYGNSWGPNYHVGLDTVTLPHGVQVRIPKGGGFIDADEFDRMHAGSGNEVWIITKTTAYIINPAPVHEIHFY